MQAMSQAESSNCSLIETEVMADLVAHCLDDLRSQTFAIVTEMADKRVAEDQDLVRDPTAASGPLDAASYGIAHTNPGS